jgi:MerR family transcriptional regulator/heat shock protein HspR
VFLTGHRAHRHRRVERVTDRLLVGPAREGVDDLGVARTRCEDARLPGGAARRRHDRLGLVSPQRSSGGGRRYSEHDVDLLREVQRLSQDEGVDLAGIKRIIELTNQVEALRSRLREMADEMDRLRANQRRDVAVVPKSTALVVWQPRKHR